MPGYVFISYSRADRAFVDELAKTLVGTGIPVWYDFDLEAGDEFAQRIESAIDGCSAFLLVLTPESASSKWVLSELAWAERQQKNVLPLLLRPCRVPIQVVTLQQEDVTGGRMPSPGFLARLSRLTDATSSQPNQGSVVTTFTTEPGAATERDDYLSLSPATSLAGHVGGIKALTVSPDGSWLASGGEDGTVRIWDVESGTARGVIAEHKVPDRGDGWGGVMALTCPPDGSWLACGWANGILEILDLRGDHRLTLAGHRDRIYSLTVAQDGTFLVSASADSTAQVWKFSGRFGLLRRSIEPHATLRHFRHFRPHDAALGIDPEQPVPVSVFSAVVSPDSTWVATRDADGVVRKWDTDGRQQTLLASAKTEPAPSRRLDVLRAAGGIMKHSFPSDYLAMPADGSWLAAAGPREHIRIWEMRSNRLIRTPSTNFSARALVASPDGSWLAAGGEGEHVLVWDAQSGQPLSVLAASGTSSLVAAKDSSWLATAGGRGMVEIHDPHGQRPTIRLVSPRGAWNDEPSMSHVAVAPDGSWLAGGGGGNGTISIWHLT